MAPPVPRYLRDAHSPQVMMKIAQAVIRLQVWKGKAIRELQRISYFITAYKAPWLSKPPHMQRWKAP